MQIIVVGIKYRDLGHRLHRQELRVQEPRTAILASTALKRQCRPPESRTLLLQCAVARSGRQCSAVSARSARPNAPGRVDHVSWADRPESSALAPDSPGATRLEARAGAPTPRFLRKASGQPGPGRAGPRGRTPRPSGQDRRSEPAPNRPTGLFGPV